MKIILIIYLATIGFCALMIIISTLEIKAYVKKHNLKRREIITLTERITGNLRLIIISVIPVYNVLVGVILLSNAGHELMKKTICEQFCEKEE